jgi:hypothetical protein
LQCKERKAHRRKDNTKGDRGREIRELHWGKEKPKKKKRHMKGSRDHVERGRAHEALWFKIRNEKLSCSGYRRDWTIFSK